MSENVLRIIVGAGLILHGIGHAMYFLAMAGVKLSMKHSTHSWCLTNTIGKSTTVIIGAILYLASIITFCMAGMGLFNFIIARSSWMSLALVAACVSSIALFFFWHAFPFFFPNKVGVMTVNAGLIISLVFMDWLSKL